MPDDFRDIVCIQAEELEHTTITCWSTPVLREVAGSDILSSHLAWTLMSWDAPSIRHYARGTSQQDYLAVRACVTLTAQWYGHTCAVLLNYSHHVRSSDLYDGWLQAFGNQYCKIGTQTLTRVILKNMSILQLILTKKVCSRTQEMSFERASVLFLVFWLILFIFVIYLRWSISFSCINIFI